MGAVRRATFPGLQRRPLCSRRSAVKAHRFAQNACKALRLCYILRVLDRGRYHFLAHFAGARLQAMASSRVCRTRRVGARKFDRGEIWFRRCGVPARKIRARCGLAGLPLDAALCRGPTGLVPAVEINQQRSTTPRDRGPSASRKPWLPGTRSRGRAPQRRAPPLRSGDEAYAGTRTGRLGISEE